MEIGKNRKKEASNVIWAAWQNGYALTEFPKDLFPMTRSEAYRIQLEYAQRSSKPVFGWKIAATSLAGQQHIGVSGPIAGLLLGENIYKSGSKLTIDNNRMAVAEAEFAFSIKQCLGPRTALYTENEVIDAINELYIAIELPNSRFEHFEKVGDLQLIVDNACAHQFILGDDVDVNWKDIDLAEHKVIISTKRGNENRGSGATVLDHPITALTWLVNELSKNELPLDKDMIVTTGSCTTPISIERGDSILADFGKLGSVSVEIE